MKRAKCAEDVNRVLDYIRPNLGSCIYLYIDVAVYGIESELLDLWYDEDEHGINFVVMRYHDSLQIYSDRNDWDKASLLKIIDEYDIQAVNAKMSMIDRLESDLSDKFESKSGWVFRSKPLEGYNLKSDATVEIARPEDTEEIAELMCSDEQWSKTYKKENLASQLRERMKTGMGRSFIIRDGDRIVAHDGTFAETEDIVMCSGLIVHKDYVDRLYAAVIGIEMDRQFMKEGKEKYFHISDEKRMKIFKRMGHTLVAETGKWIRKKA